MTLSYKFVSFAHAKWADGVYFPIHKGVSEVSHFSEARLISSGSIYSLQGCLALWCLGVFFWMASTLRVDGEFKKLPMMFTKMRVMGKQHKKNRALIGWALLGKNIEKMHSWGLDNFGLNHLDPLICRSPHPLKYSQILPSADSTNCSWNTLFFIRGWESVLGNMKQWGDWIKDMMIQSLFHRHASWAGFQVKASIQADISLTRLYLYLYVYISIPPLISVIILKISGVWQYSL